MTRPSYPGKPLPIGYVELQASWVGPFEREKSLEVFGELMQKAAREHPGMIVHGSRLEQVTDGAGVLHNNYYLGLEPKHKAAEPLGPRKLNETPEPDARSITVDDAIPPGWKEQKFGRGT